MSSRFGLLSNQVLKVNLVMFVYVTIWQLVYTVFANNNQLTTISLHSLTEELLVHVIILTISLHSLTNNNFACEMYKNMVLF